MKQKQLLAAISEAGMNMQRNAAAISGAPKADYPLEAGSGTPGRSENGRDGRVPFSRQRQPKGQSLEEIHARVKPETAAWLRELAGDSSIGIVLDHLRNILPR